MTDFVIKYKYNPMRDEYDKAIVCSTTGSSAGLGATYEDLCTWASYDNGGHEQKKTFELAWVRDDSTALEAAKKLVEYHTSRRWWIKFNI